MCKTYVYSGDAKELVLLELEPDSVFEIVELLLEHKPDLPIGFYMAQDVETLRKVSTCLNRAKVVRSIDMFLSFLEDEEASNHEKCT